MVCTCASSHFARLWPAIMLLLLLLLLLRAVEWTVVLSLLVALGVLLLLLRDGCSTDCPNTVSRKPGMDGELTLSPLKVPAANGAIL
jgi:hypothetical protein